MQRLEPNERNQMTTDPIDAHEASMDDIASIAELLRGPEPGAVARSEEVLAALDIAESAIQREQQRLSDEQKELDAETDEISSVGAATPAQEACPHYSDQKIDPTV
jgi:hypothetical protein